MSFDVDVDKAKHFAVEGSLLKNCSGRHGFACCSLPSRRRWVRYCIDESWQFFQQATWDSLPSSPSAPPKRRSWHLADLVDVYPLVVADMSNSASQPSRQSDLEFEAVYGRKRLKFRAETREEMKLWVTALQSDLARRQGQSSTMQLASYASCIFSKADENRDGQLTMQEVAKLLEEWNIRPSRAYLEQFFKVFDKDHSNSISQEEFQELFEMMMIKAHLRELFERYSVPGENGKRTMPISNFVRLWREVQGEPHCTEESVSNNLLADLGEQRLTAGGALTEMSFNTVMCHRINSIYDPQRSKLYQDMTRPLSHYWINCSHNTYLEGAQIAGVSSVEQYVEVLSQGCRCVEIDLWDGLKGEPMVTHGYTLSTKVSFEEVAQTLHSHAFNHSDFPLILSLENHCSPEQVVRVGDILIEVFGESLLTHPSEGLEGEALTSPHEARRRVIIKGSLVKVPREDEDYVSMVSFASSAATTLVSGTAAVVSGTAAAGTAATNFVARSATSLLQVPGGQPSQPSLAAGLRSESKKSFSPNPVVTSMAELAAGVKRFNSLIYLVSKKMHYIDEEREPCNISSFSEHSAVKLCKKHGKALNEYHKENLSRIYPPGQNVTSSNLAPHLHWAHGAQLVAMNFQTMDTSVLLNEGLFGEQNGGYGYVLKPEAVLNPNAAKPSVEQKLDITVLSAHFLPRPGTDEDHGHLITTPMVIVTMHNPDGSQAQHETQPVQDDGFAPSWDELFSFTVERDDLSIITFEVMHLDPLLGRYPLAAAAFPANGLRSGVRWVPLFDKNRRPVTNCGILVKVEKPDNCAYWESRRGDLPRTPSTPCLSSPGEPTPQHPFISPSLDQHDWSWDEDLSDLCPTPPLPPPRMCGMLGGAQRKCSLASDASTAPSRSQVQPRKVPSFVDLQVDSLIQKRLKLLSRR